MGSLAMAKQAKGFLNLYFKFFYIMNKKLIIALSAAIAFTAPVIALAAFPNPPALPGTVPDLWTVVVRVLQVIWPIFIGLSIIMYIIAGFLFVTANGDPGKIGTARQSVIWATVGIVVALISFSLPWVIGSALGV